MKLRFLRRRWSIAAPQMTVRSQRPWWVRAIGIVIAAVLIALLARWTFALGSRFAGLDRGEVAAEIARLTAEIADLRAEREALQTGLNSANSHLTIERAAQDKLLMQIKSLEGENDKLRQDLAFFERILPAATGSGVSIRSFQIERESGDSVRLRYRVLVGQSAKAASDFSGEAQLTLVGVREGRNVSVPVTAELLRDPRSLVLSFRLFQRVEGVIEVPSGMRVRSVQVRVLDRGEVRAQQTALVN